MSKTEKGPAGRPVDIDSKLTSECKTQEKSIPEKGLVSSEMVKIVCSVYCVSVWQMVMCSFVTAPMQGQMTVQTLVLL